MNSDNSIELKPGPPPKLTELPVDDSWAQVELFRWQYGSLPGPTDTRPLNVSVGLQAMANAIEDGCKGGDRSKMPTPFNVCEVLRFCSRKMAKL